MFDGCRIDCILVLQSGDTSQSGVQRKRCLNVLLSALLGGAAAAAALRFLSGFLLVCGILAHSRLP